LVLIAAPLQSLAHPPRNSRIRGEPGAGCKERLWPVKV
jgi:hypothetical protein